MAKGLTTRGTPVPGLEVSARYHYPAAPAASDTANTDGDGWARGFRGEHPETPVDASLYVAERPCDTIAFSDGMHVVLELRAAKAAVKASLRFGRPALGNELRRVRPTAAAAGLFGERPHFLRGRGVAGRELPGRG